MCLNNNIQALQMDHRTLLRLIADGEMRFVNSLQLFHPYTILHVRRINIEPHRWFIATVRDDQDVWSDILIPKLDVFNNEEEFAVKVGMAVALLMYWGGCRGIGNCNGSVYQRGY